PPGRGTLLVHPFSGRNPQPRRQTRRLQTRLGDAGRRDQRAGGPLLSGRLLSSLARRSAMAPPRPDSTPHRRAAAIRNGGERPRRLGPHRDGDRGTRQSDGALSLVVSRRALPLRISFPSAEKALPSIAKILHVSIEGGRS